MLEIKDKIRKFRDLYGNNEMAVREHIINPILRALGWDPENPEEVRPEVAIEGGIPDYTLMKQGKIVLFIEVKNLSMDIEKKETIRQLARYCFEKGVSFGVLTNGAEWLLLRAFQEGKALSERIVWKIDLENDDLVSVIRRLSTISKNNIEQINHIIEKLEALDDVWNSLIMNPEKILGSLIPIVSTMVREAYPQYNFSDIEIRDFLMEKLSELFSFRDAEYKSSSQGIKASSIHRILRISDDVFEIKSYRDILIKTAEWLIKKGKLTKNDYPISSGYKRYLINIEPKHRYGRKFRSPKRLSNGLYLETHQSAAMCISLARKLLERFGYSGDILKVE